MQGYGLFGHFQAQPGKRDALAAILQEAAALLGRDPACWHYVVGLSDDPDRVWVWELWRDEAAHDASLGPADVRALIQQAMPLIAVMGEQTHLTVLGGQGVPQA